MRLRSFKALSFGCYGTLIDRESGIYAALRPLLLAGRITLDRADVLAAFTRHEVAQQADTPSMLYSAVLTEAHRRLAKEWGVLLSDDSHALFGKSVAQWPVFADAPAALQYLKRYFKLFVLSNVDKGSFAATGRRLEVQFEGVFTAEEIGSYKPDRRNFDYLLKKLDKLGIRKDQLLHVAADLARDQVPAARCGLAFAWIDRPREPKESAVTAAPSESAGGQLRFASIVDMVKAHREELLA
jgi:2-haloalkanoic acid dehalogenase type II